MLYKIAVLQRGENIDWIPWCVLTYRLRYALRGKKLVNLQIIVNPVLGSSAWKATIEPLWKKK